MTPFKYKNSLGNKVESKEENYCNKSSQKDSDYWKT